MDAKDTEMGPRARLHLLDSRICEGEAARKALRQEMEEALEGLLERPEIVEALRMDAKRPRCPSGTHVGKLTPPRETKKSPLRQTSQMKAGPQGAWIWKMSITIHWAREAYVLLFRFLWPQVSFSL